MLLRYVILAACVSLTQIGCTSMSSTMLTRDESNSFWTRKGNLKGVPITLKVPTHVQLTIFERHFLFKNRAGKNVRLRLPFVVRDFSQEFIYNEKIFTVDFKRPAAGLYNLNLDLTPDQYINELQHDVTDETIREVTALLKQFAPSGLDARTVSAPEEIFEEIQSVVAVDMFEIDDPEFENQMAAFVNCHLNQAHDAWVAPTTIKHAKRVTIEGTGPTGDALGYFGGPATDSMPTSGPVVAPQGGVSNQSYRSTPIPRTSFAR